MASLCFCCSCCQVRQSLAQLAERNHIRHRMKVARRLVAAICSQASSHRQAAEVGAWRTMRARVRSVMALIFFLDCEGSNTLPATPFDHLFLAQACVSPAREYVLALAISAGSTAHRQFSNHANKASKMRAVGIAQRRTKLFTAAPPDSAVVGLGCESRRRSSRWIESSSHVWRQSGTVGTRRTPPCSGARS